MSQDNLSPNRFYSPKNDNYSSSDVLDVFSQTSPKLSPLNITPIPLNFTSSPDKFNTNNNDVIDFLQDDNVDQKSSVTSLQPATATPSSCASFHHPLYQYNVSSNRTGIPAQPPLVCCFPSARSAGNGSGTRQESEK